MKEYGIYQRRKSGLPFMIHKFKTIEECKIKLYELIANEEYLGHIYFVDNDFYKNKYNFSFNGMYFCIQERDVTEFIKYTEQEEKSNNSNIYYFNNYKQIK